MERYDIFFSGKLAKGADPAKVREGLRRRLKLSEVQLESMFAGTPVRIKTGAELDSAAEIRGAMREIGALVDIRPSTPDAPADDTRGAGADAPAAGTEDTGQWSVQPARGHDLSDCRREEAAAPIPDISAITLAQAGVVLDDRQAHAVPKVRTDHIQLMPANTGSLEDCAAEKKPVPIPDISGLSLEKTRG